MADSRWELPAETELEEGASDPLFPRSAAEAALEKLDELLDRIVTYENQDRPGLVSSLDDWAGPYRAEFDEVEGLYLSDLSDLKTVLAEMGDDIVDHAGQANAETDTRNTEAREQADEDGESD